MVVAAWLRAAGCPQGSAQPRKGTGPRLLWPAHAGQDPGIKQRAGGSHDLISRDNTYLLIIESNGNTL